MTSIRYRGLAALVLTMFCFGNVRAEYSFKLIPGLLYGSAPKVFITELLPRLSISDNSHVATFPLDRRPVGNYESTTVVLRAVTRPLHASRLLTTTADPDCDEFLGSDKWRHVGVWFAGTLGIYLFFKTIFKTSKLVSYLLSATAMSIVGLAREISDSNSEKHCFSEQDLLANTMGILAAGLVITIF